MSVSIGMAICTQKNGLGNYLKNIFTFGYQILVLHFNPHNFRNFVLFYLYESHSVSAISFQLPKPNCLTGIVVIYAIYTNVKKT